MTCLFPEAGKKVNFVNKPTRVVYVSLFWLFVGFFKSTPRKFLLCSIKARNPEQARGTHLTCSGSQSEQDSLHIAHRHCSNIIKANNVSARYIKTVGMHFRATITIYLSKVGHRLSHITSCFKLQQLFSTHIRLECESQVHKRYFTPQHVVLSDSHY